MNLSNIRIQSKVFMALAVPLIGMLAAAGVILYEENQIRVENTRLYELTAIAPETGGFVHELQKERALSVAFVNAKDDAKLSARDKMTKQRSETDAAYKIWTDESKSVLEGPFDESVKNAVKDAAAKAGELASTRSQIDQGAFNGDQTAKYFTETNAKYINVVSSMASLSTDAEISEFLIAYFNWLNAKEKSGIERAVGANGLGQGVFNNTLFARFVGLSAQQDIHLAIFKARATPELVKFYESTVTGSALEEVSRIRKAIVDAGTGTALDGSITAAHWIDVTTQKIDLMKQVEDKVASGLIDGVVAAKNGATQNFIVTVVLSGIAVLLALGLGYVFVRSITVPLAESNKGLQELANDNLDYAVTGAERKDEIGDIARAMAVFKQNALDRRKMAAAQEAENKAKLARANRIEELINSFDRGSRDLLNGLAAAATEMEATAQSMASLAQRTSQQSTMASSAAGQAGSNVQNVASASEELSASIAEIAQQMNKSSAHARAAITSVEQAQQTIQLLSEAGNKISQVVGLITAIAEQTNLLALNATIEAARAGDAGKGFAVVASEVKSLATQTQKATDEISDMIKDVQFQTSAAVEVISNVGKTIADLNETTAAIEEQTSATQEISRNVQEAAAGTSQVNSGINEVNAGAEESGRAAEDVLAVSKQLSNQSEQMKGSIEVFLSDIRAA